MLNKPLYSVQTPRATLNPAVAEQTAKFREQTAMSLSVSINTHPAGKLSFSHNKSSFSLCVMSWLC